MTVQRSAGNLAAVLVCTCGTAHDCHKHGTVQEKGNGIMPQCHALRGAQATTL
jgi:hypothetical protein